MSDSEHLKKVYEQLVCRHRKLIEFLCQRASYGNETYYLDLLQECYMMLLRCLPNKKAGISQPHERAWVFWRCRDAIARYRYQEKRFLRLLRDSMSSDTSVAHSEVSQLTIDDLASCLSDAEQRCFHLMAAGASDKEIEQQLDLQHRSLIQMRHEIKKKLHKYLEQ